MGGFLLWLKNLIGNFFYGQMSTEDIAREGAAVRNKRLEKMVDARGQIKGVAKDITKTLADFGTRLAMSKSRLDREVQSLAQYQEKLAADPTDSDLQFEVGAHQKNVALLGTEVARWQSAISDLNIRVQQLKSRDATTGHAIAWQDFQNNVSNASSAILISNEAYKNAMEQVVKSQKVFAGFDVSVAEAFLERRRNEVGRRINVLEGTSEALDDLVRGRAGTGQMEVPPEATAAIEASRSRLGLPATTSPTQIVITKPAEEKVKVEK